MSSNLKSSNRWKGNDRPALTPIVALSVASRDGCLESYFGSNERVFKGFTLFVGDYWRFLKDCFQQRLSLYKALLFHQYLF